MNSTVDIPSLLKLTASPFFWVGFEPASGDRELAETSLSLQDQADGLTAFLDLWAREVHYLISSWEAQDSSAFAAKIQLSDDQIRNLSQSLASLLFIADTLLKFKRRDYLVHIPPTLLGCANTIFTQVEVFEISSRELTVPRVALRLAAATSHLIKGPRRTTIDEQGRTFTLDGERLFQFDPQDVLRGQQEYRARKIQSFKRSGLAEG